MAKDPIILQNLVITPVRRSNHDIQEWLNNIRAAESTIPNRTRLYDMYEDVLLDGMIEEQIGKRVEAVSTAEWTFTLPDGQVVDEITDLINTLAFTDMLAQIMQSKFWGITLLYFAPDGTFAPVSVPRKHIKPQLGIIGVQQNDLTGIKYKEVPNANWMVQIGSDTDLGRLKQVAFWSILKRGNIGDWAQFNELFGMPYRTAEYDAYDDNARVMLETAMREMGAAPYSVIPKGTSIQIHDSNSNAKGDVYDLLQTVCDKQISICILGETMTTMDTAGSGYAQSKTHEGTKQELKQTDILWAEKVLNEKIKPILLNLGYKVDKGKFCLAKKAEKVPLTDQLNIALKVAEKVPVEQEYFYTTFGIPKPAAGAAIVGGSTNDDDETEVDIPTKDKKGKKVKAKDDLQQTKDKKLSLVNQIRLAIADFFDPAL